MDIAEPDFGLITNVGRGHLLGFGLFEGVVDTKCELYDFLRAQGGKVFLRHEDEILSQRAAGLVAAEYGITPGLFVSGHLENSAPYLSFSFVVGKEHFDVDTKLIGSYNLPNALQLLRWRLISMFHRRILCRLCLLTNRITNVRS